MNLHIRSLMISCLSACAGSIHFQHAWHTDTHLLDPTDVKLHTMTDYESQAPVWLRTWRSGMHNGSWEESY